ncbi:MAG: 50S ribosomal protein L9 [Firmicutes bacterium]|nr:50S ribosomal protein L9 [Bacillota bacterium]
MQIILQEDVKGTGKKGDIIKVKDGHGRFLVNSKKAIIATPQALKQIQDKAGSEAHRHENAKNDALTLKGQIEKTTLKFTLKSGKDGKVFGSVTSADIEKEINAKLQSDLNNNTAKIDKKDIVLKEPIKFFGTHIVDIKLFASVTAKLNVEVVSE